MVALAGIMVRNAILLVDFVNLRLKEGAPLKEAVVEAGAVRTTPILLTAGTVVIGAIFILFDPIFQGLAIALMGGTIASTFLTLIIIPLIYYMTEKKRYPENQKTDFEMRERIIRAIAGTLILTSLILAYYVDPAFYFVIVFVGLNLLQSSITKWCLMDDILRKVFSY